jgi:hypothetical protein
VFSEYDGQIPILVHRQTPFPLFAVAPTSDHRASVKSFVSLQFLNSKTAGRTPWTGDQPVARPLSTQKQKHRINADIHPCLEWDSNSDPSVRASEDSSCFRPRGQCDRLQASL